MLPFCSSRGSKTFSPLASSPSLLPPSLHSTVTTSPKGNELRMELAWQSVGKRWFRSDLATPTAPLLWGQVCSALKPLPLRYAELRSLTLSSWRSV
ncbi:hypothetical protein D3C87_1560130 [compost metagenome]